MTPETCEQAEKLLFRRKSRRNPIRKLFGRVRELSVEGRTVTVRIRGSDEIRSHALLSREGEEVRIL